MMDCRKNTSFLFLAGIFMGVIIGAAAFELGLYHACPSRICVDNADVTPVTDRAYFDAAHRIISEAGKSVHIVAYELNYYGQYPQSSQSRLVRDLLYARERGVDVKVFLDDQSDDRDVVELLRSAGVEVRRDDNETVTHAKVIVVDGRIVLTGSTNLSFWGLERNNEANVLIRDEKTAEYFERYFQNLWGKKFT